MDRYRPQTTPRRRRGPTAARRRRGRAIAPTNPRLWWSLAAGLLLLMLLVPLRVHAQGLRSATASVSIVAIKRDPLAEPVRDFTVAPTWEGTTSRVSVRLAAGSDAVPLYVRATSGRLVRVDERFVDVAASTLRFRAVAPSGQVVGAASWHVEVRSVDATTGRAQLTDTRIVNR